VSETQISSPSSARIIRRGQVLSVLGLVGLAAVYVLALGYTPIEARQGLAQKIFYLHVPSAWSALLAFSLVGMASALYLWLHDQRLDRFAAASAEVGVAFSVVMLTTGPIWAKPIWGT
jgi:heme exporter protein C